MDLGILSGGSWSLLCTGPDHFFIVFNVFYSHRGLYRLPHEAIRSKGPVASQGGSVPVFPRPLLNFQGSPDPLPPPPPPPPLWIRHVIAATIAMPVKAIQMTFSWWTFKWYETADLVTMPFSSL